MNHCQAGHEPHKRITVPSIQGDFLIYNYKQYMGFNGYCTGQDDVSRTIDLYGKWDEDVYQCILSILETAKPGGVFIDIGCHIGWFSKLVSEKGFIVKSFDGESENLILAEVNAPNAVYTNLWFDEKIELLGSVYECELMKMDIEGNEQWGVKYFEKSFEAGCIKNVIMEISPVFNNSYPSIIEKMKGFGYDIYLLDGTKWDGELNFDQSNFLFKKL